MSTLGDGCTLAEYISKYAERGIRDGYHIGVEGMDQITPGNLYGVAGSFYGFKRSVFQCKNIEFLLKSMDRILYIMHSSEM